MRLRLVLLSAALGLLAAPTSAAAAPGLLVGVVDNSLMWTHQPEPIVAVQRDLGLGAIRLSVRWRRDQWSPTPTQVTELNRAVHAAPGVRLVLSSPASVPTRRTTASSRTSSAGSRSTCCPASRR